MSNDARPVAIRIARPYSSEEAFLEHELETLTRTSVTLIGAQARPQGVILRFEVTLASGAPLLRGEGRVVGYKRNAIGDEPGLTLRFTRLDPRSKALIDRAAAMREAKARSRSAYPPPPPGPLAFHPAGTDEPTQIGPPPSTMDHGPNTAIPSRGVPPPPVPSKPDPEPRTMRSAPPSRAPSRPPSRAEGTSRSPSNAPGETAQTAAYDRETIDRLKSQRALRDPFRPGTPAPGTVSADPPRPTQSSPPAKRPSSVAPAARSRPAPPPPSPVPETAPQPPPAPQAAASARHAPASTASSSLPMSPPPPTSADPRTAREPLASPPNRAELLGRLRDRARSLAPARVTEILARRAGAPP